MRACRRERHPPYRAAHQTSRDDISLWSARDDRVERVARYERQRGHPTGAGHPRFALVHHLRSFHRIEERAAVGALDADAIAWDEVAQHGKVRVPVSADDAIAALARHGGTVEMTGRPGQRPAARTREHDHLFVRTPERDPRHR
jgi:hypothetical protein